MNPIVENAINALYGVPDRRAIEAACQVELPIVGELLSRLKQENFVEIGAYPRQRGASVAITVTLQDWFDGAFVAQFRTRIRVSRLAAVFHVEHAFSVQNRHPQPVAPSLDGFGDGGYILPQLDLHRIVKSRLEDAGYTELSLWDMDSPVAMLLGTPAQTTNTIPTVRLALFEDLLDVLSDE